MTHNPFKKISTLFVFTLFSAALGFSQSESDAYRTETFNTSNSPMVDIQTSGGFVNVYGHDSDEVKVLMFVRRGGSYLMPSDTDLSDFNINISQSGNRVVASAEREQRGLNIFNRRNSISISFEVYVPEESTVNGRTSGGSVTAENLHNETVLRTSGGSVTAKTLSGDIELRTSGGSLNLEDLQGTIFARTSGGSVNAELLRGVAELRTSGGSLTIRESAGEITASTSGGSIRAQFTELTDNIDLKTSGGSIRINIPNIDHFEMDLKGTRVETDLRNFTGTSERNSIRGRVGNGGPKITAKTSGGSVTLSYD